MLCMERSVAMCKEVSKSAGVTHVVLKFVLSSSLYNEFTAVGSCYTIHCLYALVGHPFCKT